MTGATDNGAATKTSPAVKVKPLCVPHYMALSIRTNTAASGASVQTTTNKLVIEAYASAWSSRSIDKMPTIMTAPMPKMREGATYLAAGAAIAAVAATLF